MLEVKCQIDSGADLRYNADSMRMFLIFWTAIALVLGGCAIQDPDSMSTITPADNSAKPGTGPGAPPSSGPTSSATHFIE